MKLSLGFSPCPNDTFIFDALVNGKIDTGGIEFEVHMLDVEALNNKAFNGELDISKLSYHAFAYLRDSYALLRSGSALGNDCGPLLISVKGVKKEAVRDLRIAIPGKYTTANLLLGLAFPEADKKEELLFSDIENAVLKRRVDAGVIIHENRFTYQEKGLRKIMDLGEYWEKETGFPIPLGGIAAKRSLGSELIQKIEMLIRKSVETAFENPDGTMDYVKKYAQEMDEEVMQQHIDLYVNEYSVDLGDTGVNAIRTLFQKGIESGIIPKSDLPIFMD